MASSVAHPSRMPAVVLFEGEPKNAVKLDDLWCVGRLEMILHLELPATCQQD